MGLFKGLEEISGGEWILVCSPVMAAMYGASPDVSSSVSAFVSSSPSILPLSLSVALFKIWYLS